MESTMRHLMIACLMLLGLAGGAFAQRVPAFAGEIAAFHEQDRAHAPAQGAILFIGSSSFRRWDNVGAAFPGVTIINRAFGGSTLLDQIAYFDDIVPPYHPRQVVVYCGENDAVLPGVTGAEIARRFTTLFGMIRASLPQAQVSFVSIKASPSRAQVLPVVVEANRLVRAFLAAQPNTSYIDIYPAMLDAAGQPQEALFVGDRLHMKPAGYVIWQRVIAPYLTKD
jgi:lysophospholipase L1-like esterase